MVEVCAHKKKHPVYYLLIKQLVMNKNLCNLINVIMKGVKRMRKTKMFGIIIVVSMTTTFPAIEGKHSCKGAITGASCSRLCTLDTI